MKMLTSEIISSVVRIEFKNITGTATIVRLNNEFIGFVTAKHLFKISDNVYYDETKEIEFGITMIGDVSKLVGNIFYSDNNTDIAIIVVKSTQKFSLTYTIFDDTFYLSEEFYIIGFPFVMQDFIKDALSIPESNFPCGFVKHGYISGIKKTDGINMLLLDIHNNNGFSGSPICCYRHNRFKIIGVVSGYYPDLFDSGIEINSNSGIAIGYDINGIKYIFERYKENM